MGNVIVEEQSLQNIANSIRLKSNTNNTYKPSEMAGAITNIETGNAKINSQGTCFMFDSLQGQLTNIPPLEVGGLASRAAGYFRGCGGLHEINLLVPSGANTLFSYVSDMSYMFAGCTNLERITNIDKFDTSNVINMTHMFSGVGQLRYNILDLNLSSFNTTKVKDTSFMFWSCCANSIEGIENFDTSNVTNMANMLDNFMYNVYDRFGRTGILDISNWNTSRVGNMSGAFASKYFSEIRGNLDTSNIGGAFSFNRVFRDCISLTNFPNFINGFKSSVYLYFTFSGCTSMVNSPEMNTSNITNMGYTFHNCTNLVNLYNYNVSNVSSIEGMCRGCTNLVNIPNFSFVKQVSANSAFSDCTSLTEINLTMPSLYTTASMFQNCTNLTSVANCTFTNIFNTSKMFLGCTNLQQLCNIRVNSGASNISQMVSQCNNLDNAAIDIIINICLNSGVAAANRNLMTDNTFSPFYNTIFDNSYYTNRHAELTTKGWVF